MVSVSTNSVDSEAVPVDSATSTTGEIGVTRFDLPETASDGILALEERGFSKVRFLGGRAEEVEAAEKERETADPANQNQ